MQKNLEILVAHGRRLAAQMWKVSMTTLVPAWKHVPPQIIKFHYGKEKQGLRS